MKLKDIPYYIPKDSKDREMIAKILENYFIDFINKTGLEPIEAILEFTNKYNIRIEDIEDYIQYMNTLLSLAKNKNVKSRGLF